MKPTLAFSILALALSSPVTAAEPAKPLEPCHSTMMAGGVRGPVLSKRVAPKYPEKARADKQEGMVVLDVVVRKDGTVGEVKTLHADQKPYGFEAAATEAVKQWAFQPATKSGAPVEVRCSLVFDFTLEEPAATGNRTDASSGGTSPR